MRPHGSADGGTHTPVAREPDLIDELGCEQLGDAGSTPSTVSRSRPNRDPITAAALNVRFAFGSSRSMRAAIVACSVAGTFTSVASAAECMRRAAHHSTPRPASSRTISSAKNGLPAARAAIVWLTRKQWGRPEQFGDQRGRLRIA